MNNPTPLLLVLTGKTASGKDTIKNTLLHKFPQLKKVITTTSRFLRRNESEGLDYYFLSRAEFERKISAGDFAEYVEYGGNLYGTEKKELEIALHQDTLWKIDPSRAGEVRDFLKRAFSENIADELIKRVVVIYIKASDEVVLERLKNRGLLASEVQSRMSDDARIWQSFKHDYDFVVENIPGNLNKTTQEVVQIIINKRNEISQPT